MSIYTRIISIEPVQRQSIISFITQIAFTLLGFLSTMYFAHTVGASVLGAYFLFMAYYGISSMFSDGGFGGAAIKRISEGEEQDAYFSAFFVLRLLFVTAFVVMLLASRSYFVDLDDAGLFVWLLLALIVSTFYGTIHHGIAGRGKMGLFATGAFINNASRIFLQVIAVYLGFEAIGLAGGVVFGILVAFIIELRFFDLRLVRFGWRHLKSLSTFSFWLFLTYGGTLIFSYADTIFIGYYMGNADVGIYRVVFQFTAAATFTTVALRNTLWPKISKWGVTGKLDLVEESLSRAFSYSLILAVPVFIGGVMLGDRLLYFFYGTEFARGYTVLVVLLGVQVVNVFQYLFTTYLGALDYQKEAFKVTALAATLNIILDLVLIPVIGIMGAAVATFATMMLSVFLGRRVLSKIITIRFERASLLNIMKASVVMGIIILLYRLIVPLSNVWFTLVPVVIGGVVYGYLILKMDRKICAELRSIVEKMGVGWPEWL